MDMGVVDARHRHPAFEVADFGVRAAPFKRLGSRADERELSVRNRDRFRPGLRGLEGVDAAVGEDQVGFASRGAGDGEGNE